MTDPIIKELWEIKDAMAREYEYDLDLLIAHLRKPQCVGTPKEVNLAKEKKIIEQTGWYRSCS